MEENINVVIYARYSSHSQQETSIEGQLRECRNYCEKNGYNVIYEYIDRAISGKTDKRPDFLQMIKDSTKKEFQYIVVYQLDRFARNRYDSAIYRAKLKNNGVKILSVRENITDDASGILMESVLEGMAEYYSEELKQKVTRGMYETALKCQSIGGNIPLGLKVGKDRKFEIEEETVPIVRMIFDMYTSGKSTLEIITHLNNLGYKTRRGGKFNKNSIRTMLLNKRYIGIYTYKDIEIPNGIPRIISDEQFYEAERIMKIHKQAPAKAKAKVEYLLTTKLFCGHCGEMMTGFSSHGRSELYRYYRCKGREARKCPKKMVFKEKIEDLVINECLKQLTPYNIDQTAKQLVEIYNNDSDTYILKELKKRLTQKQKQYDNLMTAIAECDNKDVRKSLMDKTAATKDEMFKINKEITKQEIITPMPTENDIRFFLNSLRKGDVDDTKYRKTLINVFINSVYLYDDKITLVFNSSKTPVTINRNLLTDINASQHNLIDKNNNRFSPPNKKQSEWTAFLFGNQELEADR